MTQTPTDEGTTCVAKVRRAGSLPEALLAIAEHLDQLQASVADAGRVSGGGASDPWGTWERPIPWGTWESPINSKIPELVAGAYAQAVGAEQKNADVQTQVHAIREALHTTADPEDRAALEARLRLLTDTGQPMGDPLYEGVTIEQHGDTAEVVLPPASPERRSARAEWARAHNLPSFLPRLDPHELIADFAIGGPLWLYHTPEGRNAMLAMPAEWRSALVTDIEQDNPRIAQEVGRDLLKQDESIDPGTAADHLTALQEVLDAD